MLGILRAETGRERPAAERIRIAGLTLLEGTLIQPEGASPRAHRRQVKRLKKLLAAGGVRRVILPEGFPYPEDFSEYARVEILPFYRGIADLLALRRLELSGLDPRRSVAALSGARLCTELTAAAERLCPQVRGVVIDVPGEGARYADRLHRAYGLPVFPAAAADVTVAFSPGAKGHGQVLELSTEKLDLCGMEVTAPSLALPRDCGQYMLAALWEYGGLSRDKLMIAPRPGGESPNYHLDGWWSPPAVPQKSF